MIPSHILSIWARGLLSLGLLVLGPLLLYRWYERAHVVRPVYAATTQSVGADGQAAAPGDERVFAPHWGFNGQTALLAAGGLATLWALPKGPLVPRRLLRKSGDAPERSRDGQAVRLKRPDGSELQAEIYGPADGPPVVLTHGWGLDGCAWAYTKRALDGCRLIVWDLPGLGLSTQPADHDYSLENLARDLDAVLALAGGRPCVLVGHSIGGMISLTHAKTFPAALGTTVCGLALVNSTYTNPVRTTRMAALKTAIEKPVLVPLLHATIALAPVVRLMNWLSYLNGSAHRSAEKSGYSGHETREQLDFLAWYTPRSSPAVLARGMLGMLGYDATAVLPVVPVPVLVVTGDADPVLVPAASEHMRATLPAAELLTLKPARHEGFLEHHAPFDAALSAFVARCQTHRAAPGPVPPAFVGAEPGFGD